MEIFPAHIKLHGQLAEVQELLRQVDDKTGWERDCFEFFKKWYDQSDSIETETSGSTGTPKTIQLEKEFMAASAKRTLDFFNLKENDRVLHCLPSRFIAGKLMTVRALIGKLDLYLVDPSTDFSFLKNESFSFAAMVPNQALKSLEVEIWNLEFLLLGGTAIPQSLEKKLQHISTECYAGYGMTETATHIALRKINGKDTSGFYRCLENIHVGRSDDDCLQVHMPGLNESPLQTTDIAELKDNKTFRILGRADHVIISGGIKYSPEEIEKKLESHIKLPFYISSLPDEKLGQQIVLIVEGNETPVLIKHLTFIFTRYLSKYEQPRQILFRKHLKTTLSGKLIRDS